MLLVLDILPKQLGEHGLMTVVKALVEAASEQNRIIMQGKRMPELYRSGIRFRNEPWAGRFETIASAPVVLKRGWGDCAHLSAYRIGELQAQGVDATCKVYWRPHQREGRVLNLFHVEVRMPDGSVEDPSRLLGM